MRHCGRFYFRKIPNLSNQMEICNFFYQHPIKTCTLSTEITVSRWVTLETDPAGVKCSLCVPQISIYIRVEDKQHNTSNWLVSLSEDNLVLCRTHGNETAPDTCQIKLNHMSPLTKTYAKHCVGQRRPVCISVLLSLKVRYYGNYCANIDEKYHIINTVSSHAVSPLSRSTGLSVSCC